MNLPPRSIVMEDNLDGLVTEELSSYLSFIYCFAGKARFVYNGREHCIQAGDAASIVVGRLMESVEAEDGCAVKVLYISQELMALSSPPQGNYVVHGFVTLYNEPVIKMSREEFNVCGHVLTSMERRVQSRDHYYYWETIVAMLQCFYYDIYHVLQRLYGGNIISLQSATIVSNFLNMLQNGDYCMYRQLNHYANKLHVSSKHLSEVVRRNTGVTANHWINMATKLDVYRHLRDYSIPLSDIVHKFHFSSSSYFVRYVQRNLGTTPTDIRGRGKK